MILSISYSIAVSIPYGLRPDAWLALTVFPVWVWTAPPVLIVLMIGLFSGRRYLLVTFPLLLVTYIASDTPTAFLREIIHNAPPTVRLSGDQSLRIISHNCHHLPSSLLALKKYDPDIVLIQETLKTIELEEARIHLFGDAGFSLRGSDLSILSRYPLTQISLDNNYQNYCMAARTSIPTQNGAESILLVPVHLYSPPFRYELWQSDCWQSYTQHRIAQKEQFNAIMDSLPDFNVSDNVIIGGDFNATAGDHIFERLPAFMRESFQEAGVGWGCSFPSKYPVVRIDQLWTTPRMKPVRCHTVDSESSDHRVVIVDYELIPDWLQQ
ncbi:endonuclease/exonuclease/phosphatase family protein [Rubinisphaera italica]|nr:endonuclease/exonuclease/phosphatase family protein [Rubinisphaera italica]HBN76370.1 hypothetical protein [Planctomycetaceae bacterium]